MAYTNVPNYFGSDSVVSLPGSLAGRRTVEQGAFVACGVFHGGMGMRAYPRGVGGVKRARNVSLGMSGIPPHKKTLLEEMVL